MATAVKDDWDKPRSQGNHLTQAEIARLRVAFNTGTRPSDIARELQCSSRVANKYYAMFRGNSRPRISKPREVIMQPKSKSGAQSVSRFYKSNFELEG